MSIDSLASKYSPLSSGKDINDIVKDARRDHANRQKKYIKIK